MRIICCLLLFICLPLGALAQVQDTPLRGQSLHVDPTNESSVRPPAATGQGLLPLEARPTTGGAQTLDDILRRQRGEKVDDSFRRDATGSPDSAAALASQLGTLGGASDAEVYRAIRYGSAQVKVSNHGPAAGVLIQNNGIWWLEVRKGPLLTYGSYLLAGMLLLLALFYLIRGRIRIQGPKTGLRLLRFTSFERFGHWLFAGSFLLLAITGLTSLAGRKLLIPAFGHEAFSTIAIGAKWIHDNVAWAFMTGLIIVVINWTLQNIPNRYDLIWLAKGGGLFSKDAHAPAKKFNAGQKIIFWACVVLGISISASGLSLLFPFQLPMFASTFAHLNDWGIPGLFGYGPLPAHLAPHEEMQYAQLWHAIIAFVFIAIIFAHIYLGTIGMEGAFDAMGKGDVELQWAREHHNLWVAEVESSAAPKGAATPAE